MTLQGGKGYENLDILMSIFKDIMVVQRSIFSIQQIGQKWNVEYP